jgi:hypothetical protein
MQFRRPSIASFKTNTFKLKFSHWHNSSGGFKSHKSGQTQKEKVLTFQPNGRHLKAR